MDFRVEPVYTWYSILYKHKSQYILYPIHNNFISKFKRLIFGQSTSRLSLEATSFLTRKWIYELSKEFTVIRIFGSKDKPFLLPFYTSDKLFVGEVCRQYKTWAIFFHDKRKRRFIPLAWKIGDCIVKHITHLN